MRRKRCETGQKTGDSRGYNVSGAWCLWFDEGGGAHHFQYTTAQVTLRIPPPKSSPTVLISIYEQYRSRNQERNANGPSDKLHSHRSVVDLTSSTLTSQMTFNSFCQFLIFKFLHLKCKNLVENFGFYNSHLNIRVAGFNIGQIVDCCDSICVFEDWTHHQSCQTDAILDEMPGHSSHFKALFLRQIKTDCVQI